MTLRVALLSTFALLVLPALAQVAPALPPPGIDTHATARRRLQNTVADVSVGIVTDAANVTEVGKVLARRSQSLIAYLKANGATRLATDQVSVETKTHTVKGGPDRIVGYSGTMKVSFRTTPEKSSDLIAGVLAQGANTLDGVSFTPSEEEIDTARRELAAEATHIAVAQAEAVARAAGEHVAGVREIVVDPQNQTSEPLEDQRYRVASPARVMAVAGAAPIATEAGDREISITVEVRVDIAK